MLPMDSGIPEHRHAGSQYCSIWCDIGWLAFNVALMFEAYTGLASNFAMERMNTQPT